MVARAELNASVEVLTRRNCPRRTSGHFEDQEQAVVAIGGMYVVYDLMD